MRGQDVPSESFRTKLRIADGSGHQVTRSTEALNAARTLVNRFGKDAVREAEIRVRELQNEGPRQALEFWLDVLKLVRILNDKSASGREH